MLICFSTHTLGLTSLKIIQVFHLLLGFTENPIISWDFKIQNSIQITEGLNNRDLDNRGFTVQPKENKLAP